MVEGIVVSAGPFFATKEEATVFYAEAAAARAKLPQPEPGSSIRFGHVQVRGPKWFDSYQQTDGIVGQFDTNGGIELHTDARETGDEYDESIELAKDEAIALANFILAQYDDDKHSDE